MKRVQATIPGGIKKNEEPASLLREQLKKGTVTLVYGAKDKEQ
jgi:hypothetical protein